MYTVGVCPELIKDNSVSLECRFLIIYIMTKVESQTSFCCYISGATIAELQLEFKKIIGRDKLYKLIKEAIEAGYIEKTTLYEKGRISGVEYTVFGEPKKIRELDDQAREHNDNTCKTHR
jgi:hypothetical protein